LFEAPHTEEKPTVPELKTRPLRRLLRAVEDPRQAHDRQGLPVKSLDDVHLPRLKKLIRKSVHHLQRSSAAFTKDTRPAFDGFASVRGRICGGPGLLSATGPETLIQAFVSNVIACR
jgi:hypothetical protein